MGLTSLQAWMDPTDWLQGAMSDDGGIDSSSPSSVDMLACSRPLMERRLRPPHDQALNCPRCDSTNTKFCYYNNYSLTQPRYFCKTCRRYWTKGGTLRNIPVGGGCRKNKKSSSSSSSSSKKPLSVDTHHNNSDTTSIGHNNHHMPNNPTDLQLSFPQVQLSGLIGTHGGVLSTSFLDNKYNALLDRPNSVGFLEGKFDALVAHSATRGHHDLLGSTNINGVDFGLVGGGGGGGIGLMDHHLGGGLSHHNYHVGLASTSSNLFANTLSSSSPFGVAVEGNSSSGHVFETAYQRLMLPCDFSQMNSNEHGNQNGFVDVKPGSKLLSLEWQGNNGAGAENKDSFGYNNGGVNGLSSWGGSMLNGYTPSTTNSFI